jgi:hypothetical protein
MPLWFYHMPPLQLAIVMVAGIEVLSLGGLVLARRVVLPRFRFHEGVNEAISGTVQAIGVFYGITVGLIAIGVWNTYSNSSDLVSREAASIGGLYRDIGGYPEPLRDELRSKLRSYTHSVIEQSWPAQKHKGEILNVGTLILDDFQSKLFAFEPATAGQTALHAETLRAYNTLIENRRLRIDAVSAGLSPLMWWVIWVGAAISIGVAYLYQIQDLKIHMILVSLMAGFLAMVLFMIVLNDKPFFGYAAITAEPYQLILDRLLELRQ